MGPSDTWQYLPRTPYNQYTLPLMSLSGTLQRNGEPVFDDILRATIDSELNYHYGAVYETAFFELEMKLTL